MSRKDWQRLGVIVAVFFACFFLPVGGVRFNAAVLECLHLVRWYAREHVLLCLIPAFFIAGGIAVFVSQASVMRYLGAGANKVLAYGVAAVSGTILAVCSCTVLPLFAGIYRMGAGLGPATAFLYSGPAINVLAIILTTRVLGLELGLARAVGAVLFSVVVGLLMHVIFRRDEASRSQAQAVMPEPDQQRHLWQTAYVFAAMVGILAFANWAKSGDVRAVFLCCPGGLKTFEVQGHIVEQSGDALTIVTPSGRQERIAASQVRTVTPVPQDTAYQRIYAMRWALVAALGVVLWVCLKRWFSREELRGWCGSSWGFAQQILPLLLIGVAVAGFLLGRPGHDGVVPSRWIEMLVGRDPELFLTTMGISNGLLSSFLRASWPLWTNLAAAVAGAFMYFATLTEVPILQGLLGAGMGKGPALALLLAGPALSLPNMLVIRSVIGTRKTIVFVALVVVMATVTGMAFGALCG